MDNNSSPILAAAQADRLFYRRTLSSRQFYQYILQCSSVHGINPMGKTEQQVIAEYQEFNIRRWELLRTQVSPGIDIGPCCWTFNSRQRAWCWR